MLKCQLFCIFSLLYVLFLWNIYAMFLRYYHFFLVSLQVITKTTNSKHQWAQPTNTDVTQSLSLRYAFALPPYQSRCKVGAKSVIIPFGIGDSSSLVRRNNGLT